MTTNYAPREPDDKQAEDVVSPHIKDMVLTHKEAEAASPDDFSVCGEEDPGESLEGLVERGEK